VYKIFFNIWNNILIVINSSSHNFIEHKKFDIVLNILAPMHVNEQLPLQFINLIGDWISQEQTYYVLNNQFE